MGGAERRRRARRRGGEERPPAPPPARAFRGIPVTRAGLLLLIMIGFWIGRLATLLPDGELRVLDVAAALASALALAIWYRRRAREYLRLRAESRERAGRSGGR